MRPGFEPTHKPFGRENIYKVCNEIRGVLNQRREREKEERRHEISWNRNKSKRRALASDSASEEERPHHGAIQWFIIRNFTKPCPLNDRGRNGRMEERSRVQGPILKYANIKEWQRWRKTGNKWQDVSHSIQLDLNSCRPIFKTTKMLFSFLIHSQSLVCILDRFLFVSIKKTGARFINDDYVVRGWCWWRSLNQSYIYLFVSPQTMGQCSEEGENRGTIFLTTKYLSKCKS